MGKQCDYYELPDVETGVYHQRQEGDAVELKNALANTNVPNLPLLDKLLEFLPSRVRVMCQLWVILLAVFPRQGPVSHKCNQTSLES